MKIILSELAKTTLLEQTKDKENANVRILLQGYGWGGPRLGLALDEPTETDTHVTSENLNFIMEKGLSKNFSQLNIDYSDSWFAKGFTIRTGNSDGCC